MKQVQTRLPLLAMLVAGVVHLAIAPTHFEHAPPHGTFFALVGLAQVAWVLYRLRPAAREARVAGVALSGGLVVVWLLTQLVATPFALAPEPIDLPTVVSKAAELLVAIMLSLLRPRIPIRLLSVSLAAGFAFWGGGLLAAQMFPAFGGSHEHAAHDHSSHNHRVPDSGEEHRHEGVTLRDLFNRLLGSNETYAWDLPPGFPKPRVPADNPVTSAKVELGRYLFYDPRLSGNARQSCASCHHQDKAFTDGLALAIGSTGQTHMRSAQTLTNVAYNATYTWANSALLSIEQQVFVPLFNQHPIEMGLTGHEAEVLDRFRRDTLYQRLFTRAFPSESDPYQIPHIVQALSSFLRTLISGHSAYDRFVYGGDSTALSASARRGLELAFSEELECHHCHGGFNFTLSTLHEGTRFFEAPFHNTGLYNVDGKGAYPSDNTGLYEVTGRPQDMGRFRAPTLRNIALTAPYMHDGSIASLEDVIRFYEQGGRQVEAPPHAGDGRKNPFKSGFVGGFRLTDTQRADLLAFLESLTDSTFICDPRFSNPFAQLPTRAVATR